MKKKNIKKYKSNNPIIFVSLLTLLIMCLFTITISRNVIEHSMASSTLYKMSFNFFFQYVISYTYFFCLLPLIHQLFYKMLSNDTIIL